MHNPRVTTTVIEPQGPHDLAASIRFLEGFTPAAYQANGAAELRLAFMTDRTFQPVGVRVRSTSDAHVQVEIHGDIDIDIVRGQVARILSLDHDGRGYAEVVARDPVLRKITAQLGMLRPVLFYSPYEAAAWAIIGNRVRIRQAARVKAEMARQLGATVDVGGEALHAFPGPEVLARLDAFPGLFGKKVEYLRALGDAVATGALDVKRLRDLEPDDARAEIMRLPGLGPFGAELVLLRAVGVVDLIPTAEARFPRAVALAYGLDVEPTNEELARITDGWAPFRTWVSVLLRSQLEAATHEITGGSAASVAEGQDGGEA